MSNYNPTITLMETHIKLRKYVNDKFVNATLYTKVIGSLKYLCNTRPYIYQSVGLISWFMENFRTCQLPYAKWILKYIKFITDHGALMPNQKNISKKAMLYGYTDSDWGGDQDDKKVMHDIFS